MKESNVGPQPTASTESVRSVSQSSAGSRQVMWVTYSLREDKKHARARRGAQSSRKIPTHVEPRVIEQKRKTNTNTTPHTHAYTPSQTRVYTPNPTAHPQNNNRAKKTHTRLHTQ